MAHVISSINITLSGSCHHTDAVADEEHHQYALNLLASSSALLLGRITFELFESFWPEAVTRRDLPSYMSSFAAELDAKPKYVLSSRGLCTQWRNTTLLQGPELEEANRLIREVPGVIVVFGSPRLAASLAAAGLVHELHVVVQPFIPDPGERFMHSVQGSPEHRRFPCLPACTFARI